jgi:hypothetical protein
MHFKIGFLGTALLCAAAKAGVQPQAMELLHSAPMRFEPASGDSTKYLARGPRYECIVSAARAQLKSRGGRLDVRFEGANAAARLEAVDRLQSQTNVLIGNRPAGWRTGIPNYARLRAPAVYPGIDVAYYGNGGALEYDFIVRAGSDPGRIRIRFTGANMSLQPDGDLTGGEFVQKRPVAYQVGAAGEKKPVQSAFRRNADGSYGFLVGAYDHRRELIIDPQLTFSGYFAGSLQDVATAVGHDSKGFVYVAGSTMSSDFATTDNPYQSANGGASDLFLVKLDPNAAPGSQVVYSTYAGGSSDDVLKAMAVRPDGTVVLAGTTKSSNFPIGNGAQSSLNGTSDGFVLVLDPSQAGLSAIFYGTYLGGSGDDSANDVAVDSSGRIYVAGSTRSNDFPVVSGYQAAAASSADAFFAAIDTTQNATATLIYSTYLGGTAWEEGNAVAVARDGTAWVAGITWSYDFPMTGAPYQDTNHIGGDVFLVHINPAASGVNSLLYSTYLGGGDLDGATRVMIDAAGRPVVTGYTLSTDFPATANALQRKSGGDADAFIAIIDPGTGTSGLIYSTYFGSSDGEVPMGIAQDAAGNIYVAGYTLSTDLPVTANALQSAPNPLGGESGFILRFNPARSAPDLSSYVTSSGTQIAAAIDVASNGSIYVAGYSSGPLLDALGGPSKGTNSGDRDGYVLAFTPCLASVAPQTAQFPAAGGPVTLTLTIGEGCSWTASGAPGWVTLSPASGSGNATITATASANDTGSARSGSIGFPGASVAVTQPAP